MPCTYIHMGDLAEDLNEWPSKYPRRSGSITKNEYVAFVKKDMTWGSQECHNDTFVSPSTIDTMIERGSFAKGRCPFLKQGLRCLNNRRC